MLQAQFRKTARPGTEGAAAVSDAPAAAADVVSSRVESASASKSISFRAPCPSAIEVRVITGHHEGGQIRLADKYAKRVAHFAQAEAARAGKICPGKLFAVDHVHIEVEDELVLRGVHAFEREPGGGRGSYR